MGCVRWETKDDPHIFGLNNWVIAGSVLEDGEG